MYPHAVLLEAHLRRSRDPGWQFRTQFRLIGGRGHPVKFRRCLYPRSLARISRNDLKLFSQNDYPCRRDEYISSVVMIKLRLSRRTDMTGMELTTRPSPLGKLVLPVEPGSFAY